MKRTFKQETHLVELKQAIQGMGVSQEEKLTGGFLGVSGGIADAPGINANTHFCGCIIVSNNCGGNCNCPPSESTPTPTSSPTSAGKKGVDMLLSF